MIKNVKFNNEDYKRILLNNNVVWQKEEGGIPSRYVMATDDDFSGTTDGKFRYIGSGEYVVVPEYIKGVKVTSYARLFDGKNVKGVANTNSDIITVIRMFQSTTSVELELKYLNVSNTTNMYEMFRGATSLTKLDLSSFDTSNVNSMGGMFQNATNLTELDLSNFDTSNTNNMNTMFQDTTSLTELDLSSFDTSKANNMYNMFYNTSATIGYARTQEDADNFNMSVGKPEELVFIVK